MKWLFFFLVLSFVATAALAAPGNSPSVPKEKGSPTVPKDDSLTVSKNDPSTSKDVLLDLLLHSGNNEAEFKVLDQYRGLNQEPQFDEAIISKLVQEHAFKEFKEADIRHAVEVARKARHHAEEVARKARHAEEVRRKKDPFLVDPPTEKSTIFFDTLHSELRKIKRGDHYRIIEAVMKTTVNSLPVKTWDSVLDVKVYNDDNNMDDLLSEFVHMLDGKVYNDDNNMDDLLSELMLMEKTGVDKQQFRGILKEARQEIKEERSQLEHPGSSSRHVSRFTWFFLPFFNEKKPTYAQNLEVDTQMIQKVVARLPGTANKDHIQRIMEQARHANSLEGGVTFNLQHALRKLVASDIEIPVSIFTKIVHKAFPKIVLKANQVEILEILRLHPDFQADFFRALINKITNDRGDKFLPLFKLLLKDKLATLDIIEEARKDIINRTRMDDTIREKKIRDGGTWCPRRFSPFYLWAVGYYGTEQGFLSAIAGFSYNESFMYFVFVLCIVKELLKNRSGTSFVNENGVLPRLAPRQVELAANAFLAVHKKGRILSSPESSLLSNGKKIKESSESEESRKSMNRENERTRRIESGFERMLEYAAVKKPWKKQMQQAIVANRR